MGTSLDELLNAEFKEAFDEFDKVLTMANRANAFFIEGFPNPPTNVTLFFVIPDHNLLLYNNILGPGLSNNFSFSLTI